MVNYIKKEKYNNEPVADKLQKLKNNIDFAKDVMIENVDKIL